MNRTDATATASLREPARLLSKLLLLASPLLSLLFAYFWLDPFRVLYHYDNYYEPPTAVALNRDYVSTEYFVQHVTEYNYDTLIFGNSRTIAYRVKDLREAIGSNIRPFQFNATEESLFGVHAKVRLVHELGRGLHHVLLVLDRQLLADTANDNGNHLKIKDPRLSGESNLTFQMTFLRAYFSGFFAPMYLHYRMIGHTLPYMTVLQRQEVYTMPENEVTLSAWDSEIARDGIEAYISRRRNLFVPRRASTAAPVIDATGEQMLREMGEWLRTSGARVEVVISPLYDEIRLAPSDRSILEAIFGATHVHDFSGENEITKDITNYYESSHYRPPVGARILQRIYRGPGESEGADSRR